MIKEIGLKYIETATYEGVYYSIIPRFSERMYNKTMKFTEKIKKARIVDVKA